MSGRFVRASKYRHVFGRGTRKEQCFDNLRISKNAWDTNLVKVNPSYVSVNWEASGGGAFAVIPINERGKLPEQIPLFRGHTAAVLDTDWSPFDDSLIASGSDDGKVLLWKVPEGFSIHQDLEELQDVAPTSKLAGHSRKVGHVLFNPSAGNVLASASGDYTIKLWDVEEGKAKLSLKHSDIVQSLTWSANGSLLATTSRDKKLRVWDVRQQKPAMETSGHSGAKNSRAVWMGELDRIATTGFSKMSDRQLGLWDIRAAREPINGFEILDQISGVCMPFWDDGTKCLYLAGKGDGNIRYYEYEADKFEYLSQHSSTDPQRGVAFMPKRGVDPHEHEIMRAFRTVNDTFIEPVSFVVPRKAEVFQEDIYPPVVGTKPGVSSSDWFSGKDALPPKFSLESVFEGTLPVEVPADDKPAPTPTKAEMPERVEPVKVETEPQPAPALTARAPPPSMKDNQNSIGDMADKFADNDESSSDEEASSFEEAQKPRETAPVNPALASSTPRTDASLNGTSTQTAPNPQPQPAPQPSEASSPEPSAATVTPSAAPGITTHRPTASAASAALGAADTLKSHLRDIKDLLETQARAMIAQSEKIDSLARRVEALDSRNGSATSNGDNGDASKDETIRMLELELEQARS